MHSDEQSITAQHGESVVDENDPPIWINNLPPRQVRDICGAYESGYGRGLSGRDPHNPYAEHEPSHLAYAIGHRTGANRWQGESAPVNSTNAPIRHGFGGAFGGAMLPPSRVRCRCGQEFTRREATEQSPELRAMDLFVDHIMEVTLADGRVSAGGSRPGTPDSGVTLKSIAEAAFENRCGNTVPLQNGRNSLVCSLARGHEGRHRMQQGKWITEWD